jgi:putative transposase
MTQIQFTLEDELVKELFLDPNQEAMKKLMEKIIDAILNAEAEEQVGAALYERTGQERTYRNGYRPRSLTTRVGSLNLHIPKLRNGNFSTELFARYQRSEKALELTLMEMVIQGVSTRRVSAITEKLCGTKFSAQTVSQLCKELDGPIKAFRERPLTASYPFICADATYTRMHDPNRGVISAGLFIVLGIREDGYREVLGFSVSEKESEETWKEMFQSLKARGLKGVRMVTSDAHCGIQKAIFAEFPGCAWQRCQTHFSRNVLDACPSRLAPELKVRLRDMYEAPTLEECRQRRDSILEDYAQTAPKAMRVLENGWNDIVSVYAFPPHLRKKLRTSNSIERLNGEVRRRESVVRIFPNEASILRLLGSVLMEKNDDWTQRRYMNLSCLESWDVESAAAPMGAGVERAAVA